MKAFRSRPSIMINRPPEDKKAELEIRNLRLSFGGVVAVRNVDLSVYTGELMAVIGPNGAGKTSLLNCITGFTIPNRGRLFSTGGISPICIRTSWSASASAELFRTSSCFPA